MLKKQEGFTILEMIIVLSIIALIFLLTLPNIQQKQKIIQNKGCEALIEVVNAQILLYEIDQQLISEGYIKDTQRRCPAGEIIEIHNGQAQAR